MTASIDITPQQRKIIFDLLECYLPNTTAWVYGSRAKWTSRPYSDLDMVVFATPEQNMQVSDLREAFEESELPFTVDLFVWDEIPNQFKKNIEAERVVLMEKRSESISLQEIAEIVMGQSPSGDTCNTVGIGTPLLNGPKEFGEHHPYPVQFTVDPKKLSKNGDILFCVRASTGQMNWSDQEYAIGRGIAAIRHKNGIEFQPFLRGLMENSLPALLASATGSVFTNLSRQQLLGHKVNVPPIPEQRVIAGILGALDDKIELNRQMNETLEAMAHTLFKSWFVDFDPVIDNALAAGNPIPEEFQTRAFRRANLGNARRPLPDDIQNLFPSDFEFTDEMGWIPEGWKIKKAAQVADISIGKTPPRKQPQWFSNNPSENVAWVSIRDMGLAGVYIGDSSEYLTIESVEKFNVKRVPVGSVLLSFKLTIGRVSIAQKELTTNEAIAHFVAPRNDLSSEYLYCYLTSYNYNALGSTSSIATAINSEIIKQMPILIPTQKELYHFLAIISENFSEMNVLENEIRNLTHLRGVLIPILLSGQISLSAVN